jgi:hypothetical protein
VYPDRSASRGRMSSWSNLRGWQKSRKTWFRISGGTINANRYQTPKVRVCVRTAVNAHTSPPPAMSFFLLQPLAFQHGDYFSVCQMLYYDGLRICLMQCHNCHQCGHVWANCKQPLCCLWCGGGHMHEECPEKGNTSFTPTCCNCRLAEDEKLHPAHYRGFRHAEEDMHEKKWQRTTRTATGRVFSSNLATPGVSFPAALRGRTEEQQQPQTHQVAVAGLATIELRAPAALPQQEQQTRGQSVRVPNVNSWPLN